MRKPKMLTCFFPTSNFFGLNMMPSLPQKVRYFAHWIKDCSMLELHRRVSSMHRHQEGDDQFFPLVVSEKHLKTEFSSSFSSLSSFPMIALYWAT